MSRALDSRVKEALKHADNEAVFCDISEALGQKFEALLEIEILGRSHQAGEGSHVLQDGNAIAIPKLRLVQAFIVSYTRFNAYLQHGPAHDIQYVRGFTRVMLLMDPEHITAANIRKRAIKQEMTKSKAHAELLLDEKYFIDSLLTSHLHRHTKSPNLWNHRRWLLDCMHAAGLPVDIAEETRSIVFISGQRHPRNFYAWCYARYLIDRVPEEALAISTVLDDTKNWCFSHHDDVSGWTFLAYLLEKRSEQAMTFFDETLKLTESLRWRNESVWYFLCVLAPGDEVGECRRAKLQPVLENIQQGGDLQWPFFDRIKSWLA